MKASIWEDLYQSLQKPQMDPVMTGFNANIDRIIQVTPDMLASFEQHAFKGIDAVLPRLKQSMRHCSADEIFISNPALYRELSGAFSCFGTLSVGGQAGIAAVHLRRLGIPSVTCVVPSAGPKICAFLKNADVSTLTFKSPAENNSDSVHLVFEYPPGLVALADGIIPRSNRFIVSPLHGPSTVIIPKDCVNSLQKQITACRRAFLSGYQYLRTQQEFVTAAWQIRMIRNVHPLMRTHVECVSGADRNVMALILEHVFPAADSIGLNEHELGLFMQVMRGSSTRSADIPPVLLLPVWMLSLWLMPRVFPDSCPYLRVLYTYPEI
jgi:ADP-dependent phosphofructokinase/glucokinase